MKVIGNVSHHEFGITIFSWNNKYLIKFEKDNLEQTYKISEFEVTGDEDIHEMLQNEAFLNRIAERFEAMQQDLNEALNPEF